MPARELDFKGLNERLIGSARELLPRWLPGGKVSGHEWICGSIMGGQGSSFSVNILTGAWGEFAGGMSGGDLVSLYAAIYGLGQGPAYRALCKEVGFDAGQAIEAAPAGPPPARITTPPDDAPEPPLKGASMSWCYRDAKGKPIFWVLRYEGATGKEIRPMSWDATTNKWIFKGFPDPRPLYGLELLAARPGAPVMVVEGEKSADAARKLVGNPYVVVTWPNGARAHGKASWEPLHGRKVLIWGDADLGRYPQIQANKEPHPHAGEIMPHEEQPGYQAAVSVAGLLAPWCPEVKILDPGRDINRKDGWDAADAVADGWTWDQFKAWAKDKVAVVPRTDPPVVPAPALVPAKIPAEPAPAAEAHAVATTKTKKGVVAAAAQAVVNMDDGEAEGQREKFNLTWAKLGLAATRSGVVCNVDNCLRVLENREEFKEIIWYDAFHSQYFTKMNFQTWENEDAREWTEIDNLVLTAFMQRHLGMTKIHTWMVEQALKIYAHNHVHDEPREWLEALKWDGKERILPFLCDAFGIEMTDYNLAVSKNWWISMAGRIADPGCQVDNMVIFEGSQGKFKSKALRAIGGQWAAEVSDSVLSKDFLIGMQGKLLIIINEFDKFKPSDIAEIKDLVTRPIDRFRGVFGKSHVDHKRRSIFVATTNKKAYLIDTTGGRRFWPVKIKHIDLKKIEAMREQCFAEAYHCYKAGEKHWIMPETETLAEQESRRIVDPWEDSLSEWLKDLAEITIKDCGEHLKIPPSQMDHRSQHRIGACLEVLGWEGATDWRDGRTVRIFKPKQQEE